MQISKIISYRCWRLIVLFIVVVNSLLAIHTANATNSSNILIVGDSLSSAYGMQTKQGWVYLLEQKLKQEGFSYQLVNASITGETSIGGAARINALLQQYKPDIVLIELGGNDGLRGLSLQQIETNLRTMIENALASRAKVLLIGMQLPPNYGSAYTNGFKDIYSNLANEFDIAFVPFLLAGVGTDMSLMQADGIHPTVEAQPKLLGNVWPVLINLLD